MSNERTDPLADDPRFREGLAALWEESRDRHLAAVGVIIDGLAGEASDDGIDAAAGAAHRLAGTLGVFGLREASDAARSLEETLRDEPTVDTATLQRLADVAHGIEGEISAHVIDVN